MKHFLSVWINDKMGSRINKITNNEQSKTNVLSEIRAGQNRSHKQSTLGDHGIKPIVPRICPKTCRNKDCVDGDGNVICSLCLTHSHYESITEEQYKSMQQGIISGFLQ